MRIKYRRKRKRRKKIAFSFGESIDEHYDDLIIE